MQDRYTGDIGDFGKYALLNGLTGHNLKLGVVWYLYPDAEPNADGRFIGYPELRHCDPNIHDSLTAIVASGNRRIASVQQGGLLPEGTAFYSTPFSFRHLLATSAREACRSAWLTSALTATAGADLVFMDPDNGIAGRSAAPTANNGPKYVFLDEIEPFIR